MGDNRTHNAKGPVSKRKRRTGAVASVKPTPPAPVTAQPCESSCLANLAHLLSQPLTALRGSLELSLLTAPGAAELRLATEEALERAEEMVRLVTLLRELAEAGTGVAETDSFLLGELVTEALADLGPLAESCETRLELHRVEDVQVSAPRAQLQRAFVKIMYRAIQRKPRRQILQIEIFRTSRQGCLEICADATADAIPASRPRVELTPIVPSFKAVKESTGLEWLLAVEIINHLGGTVLSDGPLAAGRHYRICLPLANLEVPSSNVSGLTSP